MKKISTGLCILMSAVSAFCQNNEFLPLSRYGFGFMTRTYSPFSQACGHAGLAYTHQNEFNPLNPASTAFLKVTDAEIGYNLKYKSISDGKGELKDLSGTLSYIQVGIPLRNSINQILERREYKHNYGFSFGLLPVSSTSYTYQVNDSGSVGASIRKLTGSGGLNQFQLGFGYGYGRFAAGLNLGYVFGNLQFEQVYYLRDPYPAAKNYYTDRYFGSGFRPQLGFIYQEVTNREEIRKDATRRGKIFNASVLISLPAGLQMKQYSLHHSELALGSQILRDTISYKDNSLTSSRLPLSVSAGLSYNHREHYGAVLDQSVEAWSSASLFEGGKGTLVNEYRTSAGFWIRPDQNLYGNIFKRSQYRLGGFYESGYLKVKNETLTQYGVTLGMSTSFLFQRQSAAINLGVELGKMKVSGVIDEKYFKVNFGVRLNDNEWFLKRRYD